MKLPSSHIVVTGAAGGIGKALARRFHAGGARLTLTDRDEAHLTEVCAELNALRPDSALFFVADIGTQQGNLDLIAFARQSFGPIDLFFANAGVGLGDDLLSEPAAWENSFNINVHAHRWAVEALMPEWLELGSGYFCSTASTKDTMLSSDERSSWIKSTFNPSLFRFNSHCTPRSLFLQARITTSVL